MQAALFNQFALIGPEVLTTMYIIGVLLYKYNYFSIILFYKPLIPRGLSA